MSIPSTPTRQASAILAAARWDAFLKALTDRLSQPTPDLPSVRCVTRQTLAKLVGEVVRQLHLPATFPSGKEVVAHLVSQGLAAHIPIADVARPGPSRDFIILGIQDSRAGQVDPLELLQAYNQRGVICYFSALAFYDLTTQTPAHHHIASVMARANKEGAEPPAAAARPQSGGAGRRSRLGTPVFSYGGVPFFSTKRSANSIPGVKTRILSPTTNIRIVTVEQALLDTLQFPFHCGGPEVVLESWALSAGKVDEARVLAYLETIDLLPLTRRTGALYELLGWRPGKALGSFLDTSREAVLGQPDIPVIPLLRGIAYSSESTSWKVLVP